MNRRHRVVVTDFVSGPLEPEERILACTSHPRASDHQSACGLLQEEDLIDMRMKGAEAVAAPSWDNRCGTS